jgi:hypothetical protein
MSKFVTFPLVLNDLCVEYPDDSSLFLDTVIVNGVVHARYLGAQDLPASDYFRQGLLSEVILNIKSAAFIAINELAGEGGWRNQRADDKKALGDSTLFDQLLASREAVRAKSNDLEAAVATMTYEELVAFDPLPALRQAAGTPAV